MDKEITVFLGALLSGQVTHEVTNEARKQVRMADEYESISDYITNVLKMFIKLRKNELNLSPEELKDLLTLHEKVEEYVALVTEALAQDRPDVITHAYPQGEEVTHFMKECRRRHLERLSEEQTLPLKSLVFTDMLNAYRRMKGPCLECGRGFGRREVRSALRRYGHLPVRRILSHAHKKLSRFRYKSDIKNFKILRKFIDNVYFVYKIRVIVRDEENAIYVF